MRTTTPNTPGARIRSMRLQKGLSLAALGKRARMTPSTIFRIEVGDRTPNPRFMRSLARALLTSTQHLYTGDGK